MPRPHMLRDAVDPRFEHGFCLALPPPKSFIFPLSHVIPEIHSSPLKMSFSASSRQVLRSASRAQYRSFSSTPSVRAAAEVKKLGVIGAGQMVS